MKVTDVGTEPIRLFTSTRRRSQGLNPSRRFFDPFAAAGEAMLSHHHDLEEIDDEGSTR